MEAIRTDTRELSKEARGMAWGLNVVWRLQGPHGMALGVWKGNRRQAAGVRQGQVWALAWGLP